MRPDEILYDCETYPNFFSVALKRVGQQGFGVYECSQRRDDSTALDSFVDQMSQGGGRLVGFNNDDFDYILVHYLTHAVRNGEFTGVGGLTIARRMYDLSQQIINSGPEDRMMIWDRDKLVPQVDLMKIHHMKNKARMTSLKAIQFAMRSPSIVETPIPFGTWLTPAQMDEVVQYNIHDVAETERFLHLSRAQIDFRDSLDARGGRGGSWMNLSDTSIGKRYLRERLEQRDPGCTKRKTIRGQIRLGDVMLPWIRFKHEPFDRKMRMLQDTTIHAANLKSGGQGKHQEAGGFGPVFHKDFMFYFGAGGLHGSVKRKRIEATADRMIVDVDVTSFYPRLAIVNGFYPLHLGEVFCEVYSELFEERRQWAKKTAENEMLKLGLNGVYGDSNNPYGAFYDPCYTLATTINGQLLLCVLAEAVMDIPGVEVVQANTDGLTFTAPRTAEQQLRDVCAWWEWGTSLNLERADYRVMAVRDVNNYIAVPVDDTRPPKRVGDYEYKLDWWQDPSALCVPRAAEAALMHGIDPEVFLRRHLREDPWDFMLRTKVPRSSRLMHGGAEIQRVSRYYISTAGAPLVKIMPPLKPGGPERNIAVQKNRTVQVCNRYDGTPPGDVDLSWYVTEARKLVIR